MILNRLTYISELNSKAGNRRHTTECQKTSMRNSVKLWTDHLCCRWKFISFTEKLSIMQAWEILNLSDTFDTVVETRSVVCTRCHGGVFKRKLQQHDHADLKSNLKTRSRRLTEQGLLLLKIGLSKFESLPSFHCSFRRYLWSSIAI